MRFHFKGQKAPTLEEITQLFDTGEVALDGFSKPPSYTKRVHGKERENVVQLRTESFREHSILIRALGDYTRSRIASGLHSPSEAIDSPDWSQHLQLTQHALDRSVHAHGRPADLANAQAVVCGATGEFVVRSLVKDFVVACKDQNLLHVPDWHNKVNNIHLGSGYRFMPLSASNVILQRVHEGQFTNLGEQDVVLCVGENSLVIMDVTTSRAALERKFEAGSEAERIFLEFRQAMRTVFKETNGREGYNSVSKWHVLCGNAFDIALPNIENGQAAVVQLQLPLLQNVLSISERTFDALCLSGYLPYRPGSSSFGQTRQARALRKESRLSMPHQNGVPQKPPAPLKAPEHVFGAGIFDDEKL